MNEELRTEALRINQRYLSEIVEVFDFCPWVRSVQDGQDLWREVFVGDLETLQTETEAAIEAFAADSRRSIGLLIFPHFPAQPDTPRPFRKFVGEQESIHASRHPRHDLPLAMASFHPAAKADLQSPARLVSFIRRSPDPTIQLVRRSVMAAARKSDGDGSVFADSSKALAALLAGNIAPPKTSVSDGIASNNWKRVQAVGVETIETILRDIAEDRARSYQEIANSTGSGSSGPGSSGQ